MSDVLVEWEYDERTGRYRNSATGRFMSHAAIIASRDLYLEARTSLTADTVWDILRRAEGLEPGSPAWQSVMSDLDRLGWREVETTQITAFVHGKGGLNNMRPADYRQLDTMLARQRTYWDGFMADVRSGKVQTVDGIRHRANLYTAAARTFHSRGVASAWEIELPTYPGEQVCGPNCKCSWRIVRRKDHVEAWWELGIAQSCDDCLGNAEEYAPYIIEGDTND